jgi:hypothetical protein
MLAAFGARRIHMALLDRVVDGAIVVRLNHYCGSPLNAKMAPSQTAIGRL